MKISVILVAQFILLVSSSPLTDETTESSDTYDYRDSRSIDLGSSGNDTKLAEVHSSDYPVYVIHQVVIQKYYDVPTNCSSEVKDDSEEREKRDVIEWFKEKLGISSGNDSAEEASEETSTIQGSTEKSSTGSSTSSTTQNALNRKRDTEEKFSDFDDEVKDSKQGTRSERAPETSSSPSLDVTTYAHGIRGERDDSPPVS